MSRVERGRPAEIYNKILRNYELWRLINALYSFIPQTRATYGSSLVKEIEPWMGQDKVEQVITRSGVWALAPKGKYSLGDRVEVIKSEVATILSRDTMSEEQRRQFFMRKWNPSQIGKDLYKDIDPTFGRPISDSKE